MNLPESSIAYWISHSKHKGFCIKCDQFNLTCLQEQSLSQIDDGLVHRAQSNWSVKKFNLELKQCVIDLCSVAEPQNQKDVDDADLKGAASAVMQDEGDTISLESQFTARKQKLRSASKKSNQSNDSSEKTTLADTDTLKESAIPEVDTESLASQTSRVSGASQTTGTVTKTQLISIERVWYQRTEDSRLESTGNDETTGVSSY